MNKCIPMFALVLSSLFARLKVLEEGKRKGEEGGEEGEGERGANRA